MAAPAIAEDPIATVRLYVAAFNKGDVKTMAASFASPGSILDGLAPHLWHGQIPSKVFSLTQELSW